MENKSEKNKESRELECIYGLIGELSREKPDIRTLKTLCADVGIVYENNLVQLMSKVLVRASCIAPPPLKNRKSLKVLTGEA